MMFINRTNDIQFLRGDIASKRDKARFLLLSAPSGIGKSSLVDHAFKDGLDKILIRVKVAKHEESRNVPALYIRELGRSINYFASNQGYVATFEEYYRRSNNEKGFAYLFKTIAADFIKKETDSEEAKTWIKSRGSRNDPSIIANAIFSSDNMAAHGAVVGYVSDVLKNNRLVVTLENIQNIDDDSLQFLKDLLVFNKGLYFIGEYTDDEVRQIDKNDLASYFECPNVSVSRLSIKKLPLQEIIKECHDKPEIIMQILHDSYEGSSGNLHNLRILLSDNYLEKNSVKDIPQQYDSILKQRITSLTADDSMLLAAVVAHGGCVDIELLIKCNRNAGLIASSAFNLFSIEHALERLVQYDLLKFSDAKAMVAQDSVIDAVISGMRHTKYLLISYRSWLSLYQSLKLGIDDLFISKSEILSWEVYFRALLSDLSGIKQLLDEIYELTLLSSAPKRAIRYLEGLKCNFSKQTNLDYSKEVYKLIDFGIMRTLYRLNLFEEIPKYSAQYLNDQTALIFHTSSLALTGHSDVAIDMCNNELLGADEEHKLEFLIIRIAAYRASNQYKNCENEWVRLHKLGIFANTKYEAIFLRCSDLALMSKHSERIQHLTTAIDMFKKSGDYLQEISARNALAQHLGYEGDLDGADCQLKIAEQRASEIYNRYYVVENNVGVLNLQRGNVSDKVIQRIKGAAYTCDTFLDKFIIWNNLLVAYSMEGSANELEHVLGMIEQELSRYPEMDYDLQRIALFNAHVHYLKTESHDVAAHYLEMAKQLPCLADHEYWNVKLRGHHADLDSDFRLTLDYYPVYISNWHFDFDISLGSSQ